MVEGSVRRSRLLLRSTRPAHQAKNLLVLVPWLAHHGPFDRAHLHVALLALLSFGLAAAGTYLLNDIRDREADRRHPHKQTRPLAAGSLSASWAGAFGAMLLAAGLLVAALALPRPCLAWLAAYLAIALAYTAGLKRVVLLDVLVLTALYEVRILFGGACFGIWVSPWLLGLTSFLFLSLAFLKRTVELGARGEAAEEGVPGRGYVAADLRILRAVGPACGCLAVLVLALYVTSEQVVAQYACPALLWLAGPALLYWIVRLWLLAGRGALHDDPVVFALRDPASWAAALWILGVGLAAALC